MSPRQDDITVKNKKIRDTFQHESALLDIINETITDPDSDREKLLEACRFIGKEYHKLLRNTIKITRVGDSNQRKLLHMLELEQEKLRLEQEVKDRTREIEEKNRLLEEQSEKLKEMDRLKSRFFANISHEFRTPLTLIMGPLEQVINDYDDPRLIESMVPALRNSQRLLALINQLLDLSKLEGGRMTLHAVRQDVIPFLKGVLSSFHSPAAPKRVQLEIESPQETILLYFDDEKLEKVLVNLVANAVKFTPEDSCIRVTVREQRQGNKQFPEGFLEIVTADNGIGIPHAQLPYIFDRFYQVEDADKTNLKIKQTGTGIGLALVKELIDLHHGSVSLTSRQGENSGTEFTVRLPLGKSLFKPSEFSSNDHRSPTDKFNHLLLDLDDPTVTDTNGTDEHSDESDASKPEKQILLVVEDNPEVRRYICRPLQHEYEVKEACNGKEGLEAALRIIPDLIISDVMMPEMDGFSMCKQLKKDVKTSHIPIILLTARASDESVIKGLEQGADDYITKPFNSKILKTRIKNLIDLRRHYQQGIQRELMLQPSEIKISSIDGEFMKDLKSILDKNLSSSEFNVEDLADRLFMSRATLNRKLRSLSGESTNKFIQSYRLQRAAQLLKADFGNVTEVAFEVGFSNSAYFTRCFKEKFHQLPHNYAGGSHMEALL